MHRPRTSPEVLFAAFLVTLALVLSGQSVGGLTSPALATDEPVPTAARGPGRAALQIATFNILGSNHTRGSSRWAGGRTRARWTTEHIKRRGIDVIGMQEVQEDQLRVMRRNLPRHTIFPAGRLGPGTLRLQIAYRTAMFKRIDSGHIVTTFDHQRRPIPWVLLSHRATGRRMYAVTIHNSPQGQEADRDSATRKEIRLVKRLRSRGRPVFVTGDMNEREEWFCKVVRNTDLKAANGGRAGQRRCSPPARMSIDWILGGRRLTFSDYQRDEGQLIRRTSDHAFIHADARLWARR